MSVIRDATFAAGGGVLVVAIEQGDDHEIGFYDLVHSDLPARRVPGRHHTFSLAVSPDGGLVGSSTEDGQVRLFDPAKGELINPSMVTRTPPSASHSPRMDVG